MNWLDKLFPCEDLTPQQDGTYLLRWTLWRGKDGRRLYLHKILATDWAREPHDHPKDFVSIGLWGTYHEEIYRVFWVGFDRQTLLRVSDTKYSAPWFRSFPARTIHRLRVEGKPVWTLVYTGVNTQRWGFFTTRGVKVLYAEFMRSWNESHPD